MAAWWICHPDRSEGPAVCQLHRKA